MASLETYQRRLVQKTSHHIRRSHLPPPKKYLGLFFQLHNISRTGYSGRVGTGNLELRHLKFPLGHFRSPFSDNEERNSTPNLASLPDASEFHILVPPSGYRIQNSRIYSTHVPLRHDRV